jgi:SAM-dependent methyltransferase
MIRILKRIIKKITPAIFPLEQLPSSPDFFRIYRYLISCPDLKRIDGGFIYKERFYPDYINMGGASHAIFREAKKFCQGKGIDIGAGFWAFPGSIPIDTTRGRGLSTTLADIECNSQDYVFSSHCLEHVDNWQDELRIWVSKIKKGGILFLYLPHQECEIWHPGSPFVGTGHRWIPTPDIVKQEINAIGLNIVSFDDGPDAMWSFYVCARK